MQLLAHLRVEGAERLVQQQNRRLDGERSCKRHPLALATGELGRQAIGELLQMNQFQELVDAAADLRLRPLADVESEGHVSAHSEMFERSVVLEDEPDVAPLRRQRRHIRPFDVDEAGVGVLETGDDSQQRRLTAATRTEKRGELAGGDAHRHVIQRHEAAKPLSDVFDLDAQASPSAG